MKKVFLYIFLSIIYSLNSFAVEALKCSEIHLTDEILIYAGPDEMISIPEGAKLSVFDYSEHLALVQVKGPKNWLNPFGDGFIEIEVSKLGYHTCLPGKEPGKNNKDDCLVRKVGAKSIEGIPPHSVVHTKSSPATPFWAYEVIYTDKKSKKKKSINISRTMIHNHTACIEKDETCRFRTLNKKVLILDPGTIVEVLRTESWYHIVQFEKVQGVKAKMKIGQDMLKSNSTCVDFDANKAINTDAPVPDCLPGQVDSIGVDTNVVKTPPKDQTLKDPFLENFKDQKSVDKYLSCYRDSGSSRHHREYMSKYKKGISDVVKEFVKVSNYEYDYEEIKSIFTCLLFRESSQWSAENSKTGAVGFGQFTTDGIEEVERLFKKFPYKIEAINKDIAYLESFENKTPEIRSRLSTVKALLRNYYRQSKIKAFYRNLRESDESLPDLNTSNQKIDDIITKTSLSDKSNYKFTFALSMAKMMNCVSQYKPYFDRKKVEPKSKVFVACAAAYNIGTGGFRKSALGKHRAVQFSDWMYNLERTENPQKYETMNHIVSIQRCLDGENNFPQCGTRPKSSCFPENKSADPCKSDVRYICSKINNKNQKVGEECK